jgi:hypothetical protein
MTDKDQNKPDYSFDRQKMCREETFTDMKMGTIRRLIPVKPDGSPDKKRNTAFVGQATLMSPKGPIPIQAAIPAKNLEQAIKLFPEAIEQAVTRIMEEAKKIQQKEESRIITPGR